MSGGRGCFLFHDNAFFPDLWDPRKFMSGGGGGFLFQDNAFRIFLDPDGPPLAL